MRTRTSLRLGAVIITVAAGVFALTGSAGGSIAPIPISDSIAFMSTVDGEADIYTMNPVSLAHDNLTHDDTVGLRADMEPAWSPSGNVVAFQREFFAKGAHMGTQLFLVTTEGKKIGPLTQFEKGVVDAHPSWSPDGSVVFSSNRDGNFDLYVMKPSGDRPTRLTDTKPGVDNLEPAWSPDGRWIVFTRQRSTAVPSPTTLLLLSLKTGLTYKLTPPALTGSGDRDASWSPDSRRIAFSSDRLGVSFTRSQDIFTIGVSGTGLTRVTSLPSNENHPTWSPDGTRIAFVSDRAKTDLYAIDLPSPATDKAGPIQRLTFDGAYKSNPIWRAVPTRKR
jgi:Tol biopolymer transport system component